MISRIAPYTVVDHSWPRTVPQERYLSIWKENKRRKVGAMLPQLRQGEAEVSDESVGHRMLRRFRPVWMKRSGQFDIKDAFEIYETRVALHTQGRATFLDAWGRRPEILALRMKI